MTGREKKPAFLKSLMTRLVELLLDVDAELLDRDAGCRVSAAISAFSTGASSVFAFSRSVVRSSTRDERRVAILRDLVAVTAGASGDWTS